MTSWPLVPLRMISASNSVSPSEPTPWARARSWGRSPLARAWRRLGAAGVDLAAPVASEAGGMNSATEGGSAVAARSAADGVASLMVCEWTDFGPRKTPPGEGRREWFAWDSGVGGAGFL